MKIDKDGAKIVLDNVQETLDFPPAGDMGEFYIGGFDAFQVNSSFVFPSQLKMARAQIGFKGCVKVISFRVLQNFTRR